ncbi:hypothetical protein K491DRAFT_63662 [Lophiostoma macrostomum CBS 122681]|uniref:Rhodopsin domain-containing protein n=1 Tax=Lophiostoma macrostomum CBS 122681 TaxID=1314788 RepID=A0A6A6SZ05_9PLEO|nr:hypothetical protein K491DRAFT_63662 [Lophiostoma macrostomum CBS 122681]
MGGDRSSALIVNTIWSAIAAIVIVTLRISFRSYRRQFDVSDACITLSLASSIAQDVFNLIPYIHYGYGKHAAEVPKILRTSATPKLLFWLNQIFFKLSTGLSKLSLCLVYTRLFQRADIRIIRYTRVVVYVITFTVVTYYGAATFVSTFQCNPIRKAWKTATHGTCIDNDEFRLGTAWINVITSFALVFTPLPALHYMKDRRPEVSELIGLILLGLAHTGCTLTRLVMNMMRYPPDVGDPQWTNTPANTIAMVENNIGIVAASLVVMRPCFRFISNKLHGRPGQEGLDNRRRRQKYKWQAERRIE